MKRLNILFVIGGVLYVIVELLWRGYTHWSMFLLGGMAFVAIGGLNEFLPWNISLLRQMFYGSIIVTILEFITGYIVNIICHWGVWDYSHLPFNIKGQVCLLYTFLWFLLSGVVIIVDDFLRWKLYDEEFPHYYLF